MLKKSATILALVLLGVAACTLSLSAVSCGPKSDTGAIGTISSLKVGPGHYLVIDLKPTSAVQADHLYTVQAYQANVPGVWKVGHIAWSQPDLNVQSANPVQFDLDEQEYSAYFQASESELRKVFTVKLVE